MAPIRMTNLVINPGPVPDWNGNYQGYAVFGAPQISTRFTGRYDPLFVGSPVGKDALGVSMSFGSSATMGVYLTSSGYSTPFNVSPGDIVVASGYTQNNFGADSTQNFASIDWIDGGGNIISTSTVTGSSPANGSWNRVVVVATAPGSAVGFVPSIGVKPSSGVISSGIGAQIAGLTAVVNPLGGVDPGYFDGDTFGYDWSGTPNLSSSVSGAALTLWKGATSVASPGSKTSSPPGLESILEFNGLTFHDRSVVDKYRLVSMEGINGGPNIRYNSEANPGDHGSTPLANLLGDRTFILTGRIEAHNIEKLRDMEQAMRTSFYTMQEHLLTFRVGTQSSRDVYIKARINDRLGLKEEQVRRDHVYREFQITMTASDPRIYSTSTRTYSWSAITYDDFQNVVYHPLGNISPLSGVGQRYTGIAGSSTATWSAVSGDITIAKGGGTQLMLERTDTGYVMGDGIQTIGVTSGATQSQARLFAKQAPLSPLTYIYGQINFNGASSVLNIIKVNGGTETTLATSSTFTTTASTLYYLRFKSVGNVMTVALFTAAPYMTDPGTPTQTLSFTLTSGDITLYGTNVSGGFGFGASWGAGTANVPVTDHLILPYSIPSTAPKKIMTVVNIGNWQALPIVRIYGPVTDARLTNTSLMPDETFQRYLKINGLIADGDYYEYDARKGTLVNSSGVSKLAQLDVGSKQLQMGYGENVLTFSATTLASSTTDSFHRPEVDLTVQDTWI